MSMLSSAALQKAIYVAMTSNTELVALANGQIFDAPISGTLPEVFVQLGEEKQTDISSATSEAARFDLTIRVSSSAAGFSSAKIIATQICETLNDQPLLLESGRLRFLRCTRSQARFLGSTRRRNIDLNFRAYIDEI